MESKKDYFLGGWGMDAPGAYERPKTIHLHICKILCHGGFGQENSIYDMKWGAHIYWNYFPTLFYF
jgi:hypothetical protein